MCQKDVMDSAGAMEHAYPIFLITEKVRTVSWESDFCEINAMLERQVYLYQNQDLSASSSFTQSAVVNLGFISLCGISYEHCHVLLRLDTLSRTSDLTHVVFSNCTRLSQTLLTSLIAFCWQRDDETKRWGAFQYSGKFVLILEAKICPRIKLSI